MATYPDIMEQLGAELQAQRGIEALYEWLTKVDGATYFKDKINAAYSNTVELEDDAELAAKTSLDGSIAPNVQTQHLSQVTAFESYWLATFLADVQNVGATDIAAGPIQYVYDTALEENGQIQIKDRVGYWASLIKDMISNAQTVLENVVALGALTAQATNQGVLVESGASGDEYMLDGTLVFEVTDETVGAVVISVTLELEEQVIDQGAFTKTISAERSLTVAKEFNEGQTGLTITLSLGPVVETGDNGNIFSLTTVANPSGDDSNFGKYYFEVERITATDFRVRWYRDANFIDENLVTTVDVAGIVGTTPLSIPGAAGGSTISTTFDNVNADAHLPVVGNKDSDIVFDIKSPRIGDRWTKAVTNTKAGNFQTKIAKRWRTSLPSAAVPTISDALAANVSMG